MRQKMKQLMGILLSIVVVLGLMPGMSLTAYADDPYASIKNTTMVITFDSKDWYLIDYDSSTVTLLAKECVGASKYNESGIFVEYSNNPTVKSAVDNYYNYSISTDAKTAVSGGGMFLLTKDQANAITNADVRKCPRFTINYNGWWLCSRVNDAYAAAFVNGDNGNVVDDGYAVGVKLGVRPALKLNLSSVIFSSESNTFSLKPAGYSVTITPGSNMTKTTGSGEVSQTGLTGAMTDVVYTADEGYYFPEGYSVEAVKGISVTRNSHTQITVSGTPTADAAITLIAPTAKTDQTAPTGLTATKASSDTAADGKISGVTAAMEYQIDGASTWTAVGENQTEITGLTVGTYKVRYAGTAEKNASDAASVEVGVKANATVTKAPTAKNPTYNGQAQALVEAGTAEGGEMRYAIGTATEATGPYTTSIPTKTEAGTYYVWYKVVGDENHNDTAPASVTVTITSTTSGSTSPDNSGSSGGAGGGSGSAGGAGGGSGSTDKPSDSDKPSDTDKPSESDKPAADVDVTKDPSEGKTPTGKEETSTVTAADGSTTESSKVTNTDGSTTEKEKVTSTDGTISDKTTVTEKDGTVKTQETTESADGSKVETASEVKPNGDFETKTVTTDKDGKTQEVSESRNTDVSGVVTETKDTVKPNGTSTEKTKVTQPDGDFKSETVQKNSTGEVTKTVTETKSTNDKTGNVTFKTETVKASGASESSKVVSDSKGNLTKASITETTAGGKKATVDLKADKSGNVTVLNIDSTKSTVSIPDAVVDADGKSHEVTTIKAGALGKESKVKSLVVGKNVERFEANALKNSSVKNLELSSAPKFGKNSLKTKGKLTIVVHSKSDKKAVEEQLKNAGAPNAKVKVVKTNK